MLVTDKILYMTVTAINPADTVRRLENAVQLQAGQTVPNKMH